MLYSIDTCTNVSQLCYYQRNITVLSIIYWKLDSLWLHKRRFTLFDQRDVITYEGWLKIAKCRSCLLDIVQCKYTYNKLCNLLFCTLFIMHRLLMLILQKTYRRRKDVGDKEYCCWEISLSSSIQRQTIIFEHQSTETGMRLWHTKFKINNNFHKKKIMHNVSTSKSVFRGGKVLYNTRRVLYRIENFCLWPNLVERGNILTWLFKFNYFYYVLNW